MAKKLKVFIRGFLNAINENWFFAAAIHGEESLYLIRMTGVNDTLVANSAEDRIKEMMVKYLYLVHKLHKLNIFCSSHRLICGQSLQRREIQIAKTPNCAIGNRLPKMHRSSV